MYKENHREKQLLRNKARHRALIRLKKENTGIYNKYYYEELKKLER